MDISVELRRKMIIALIEALRESSSFGNIQMSQLKEAVLNCENKTYMQAKSRDEYLYFINEKLKKIKNTSGQRFEFKSGNSIKGGYPEEPIERAYCGSRKVEQNGGRGFSKTGNSPFNMINIPPTYNGFNGQNGYSGNKEQYTTVNSSPYQNGYGEGGQRNTSHIGAFPNYQGQSPIPPRIQGQPGHCSEGGSVPLYSGIGVAPSNSSGKRNEISAHHQSQGEHGNVRSDYSSVNSHYIRQSPHNGGYPNQVYRGEQSPYQNRMKGNGDIRGQDFSTNRSYIGNVGNRLYNDPIQTDRKGFPKGYSEGTTGEKSPVAVPQGGGTEGIFYGYNPERAPRRQSPSVAFQSGFGGSDCRVNEPVNTKKFIDEYKVMNKSPYMKSSSEKYGVRSPGGDTKDVKDNADEDAFNALSQGFFKAEEFFGGRKEDKFFEQQNIAQGRDCVEKAQNSTNNKKTEIDMPKNLTYEQNRVQDSLYGDLKHKDTNATPQQERSSRSIDNHGQNRHSTNNRDDRVGVPTSRTQGFSSSPRNDHSISIGRQDNPVNKIPHELETFMSARSFKILHISNIEEWKKKLNEVFSTLSPGDDSENKRVVAMQYKYSNYPFIDLSFLATFSGSVIDKFSDNFDYSEYFERSVNAFEAVRSISKDSVFHLSSEENE